VKKEKTNYPQETFMGHRSAHDDTTWLVVSLQVALPTMIKTRVEQTEEGGPKRRKQIR